MPNLAAYLAQHPKKYLIFDFDETLFTLQMPWDEYYQGMKQLLRQFDPNFPEFDDVHQWENAITKRYGLKAAQVRWQYSTEFENKYLNNGAVEHHDLTDFIRENGPKYQLFIWTSNMRTTVEPMLKRSGLLAYFVRLVTKTDVLLIKPEPEGFEKIFKPTQQQKSEFLMIGNGRNDQRAAKAAGIDFWLRK